MKHIISLIVLFLSFYTGADVSALEDGTWVHHERQAPITDIQSIYSLPDGKIWVDTVFESKHNFHVFDGEKWKLTSKSISEFGENPPLYSDSNGHFYFLNGKELVVWDYNSPDEAPQTFTFPAPAQLSFPLEAALTDDNILYLSSFNYNLDNGGLYRFDGTTIEKIMTGPVKSVAVDTSGKLWATQKEDSGSTMHLWVMKNENWTDLTDEINSDLISNDMLVFTSPDSSVWITNKGKYGIYKDGVWSYHNGDTTLQIKSAMPLSFDYTGKVWGYGNNDIYILDNDGDWQLSYEKVISSPNINGEYFLASDSDSTIWLYDSIDIYKHSEDLPVEDSGQWLRVRSNLDLASNTVTSIAYTSEGYMVCGHAKKTSQYVSQNTGISILIDSTWHNFQTRDGFSFSNVYDLVELADEDILVSTGTGDSYLLFDGYNINKIDSLFVNDNHTRIPNDMYVDKLGDLWIPTDMGLMYHDFIDCAVSFVYDSNIYPNIFYSSTNFYNLFQASTGKFYLQTSDDTKQWPENDGMLLSFDPDEEYDKQWSKIFDGGIEPELIIRDFVLEYDDNNRPIFWIIMNNSLYNNREKTLVWEEYKIPGTEETILFRNASLLHMEEDDGLIWVSGYDNTGYLDYDENRVERVWHRIPELSGYASSVFKRSETGKIALNAIIVGDPNDNELIGFGYEPTLDEDDIKEYYGVFEFTPGGTSIVSDDTPKAFPLITNYPNPFNSSTTIQFELPRAEHVKISIYNILGQHVKTLANDIYPAGTFNLLWDSKSDYGIPVASGIYFYTIKTENFGQSGKMLLLR